MIQSSALNPAVREQMKYAIANYKQGESHIANMQKAGLADLTTETTPEGATMRALSSVTDPTMAARIMQVLGITPKPAGDGSGAAPDVNNPAVRNRASQESTEDQGFESKEYPGSQAAPPAQKGPPTAGEMGRTTQVAPSSGSVFASRAPVSPPAPDAFQGPNQAQTAAAVQEALGRNRFASTEQGVPAGYQPPQQGAPGGSPPGTFLNPATGSYEPLQQQPPQPSQAELANWQNQNVHPVIAPKAVLDAVKTNVSTAAQDATYLPNGGVNGEPAWAIHMKGGGMTTISASQFASSPWGRALMATHNASETMEAQSQPPPGQAPQPGQPQTNQPGNMLLQPPGQATAPGAQGGQVWNPMQPAPGPPAAPPVPTGPVQQPGAQGQPPPAPGITDIYGNPLGTYTNVPSRGGPTPEQLTAQTTSGGQPTRQPGDPLYPPPSNSTVPQADQDQVANQAKSMGDAPSGEYQGDRRVKGVQGPYTYYIDDNPNSTSRGRVYTTLPGLSGHYYDQQKWYLGSDRYEPYELPDSAARQQMWDKWGVTGFLKRSQIDHMSPDEMEPWLQRAWKNETFQRSDPTDQYNSDLDTAEKFHNNLKKISDIEQTLAAAGYPRMGSKLLSAARTKNALKSIQLGILGSVDSVTAQSIRTLDETIDQTQKLLAVHPTLLLTPGEASGLTVPSLKLPFSTEIPLPSIPGSNVISDSAWSGDDIATRTRNLDGLRKTADLRYQDLIKQGQEQWRRIADKHDANSLKIDQNIDFTDPDNRYTKHLHTVDPSDYNEFKSAHPHTKFLASDGITVLETP